MSLKSKGAFMIGTGVLTLALGFCALSQPANAITPAHPLSFQIRDNDDHHWNNTQHRDWNSQNRNWNSQNNNQHRDWNNQHRDWNTQNHNWNTQNNDRHFHRVPRPDEHRNRLHHDNGRHLGWYKHDRDDR